MLFFRVVDFEKKFVSVDRRLRICIRNCEWKLHIGSLTQKDITSFIVRQIVEIGGDFCTRAEGDVGKEQ